MVSESERRIALFIDFENLVTNTGISPATFDLQPAIDRLLERGKVVFRRPLSLAKIRSGVSATQGWLDRRAATMIFKTGAGDSNGERLQTR